MAQSMIRFIKLGLYDRPSINVFVGIRTSRRNVVYSRLLAACVHAETIALRTSFTTFEVHCMVGLDVIN